MADNPGVSTAPNRVWASWNLGERYGNGMAFFVGGADYAEFLANLEQLVGTSGVEMFEKEWNDHIVETLPGKAISPTEAIQNLRAGGLVGNQPQHGEERSCPHGKRQKRSGTSAKGPWTGWFCPLPKGDANQCKPEFA